MTDTFRQWEAVGTPKSASVVNRTRKGNRSGAGGQEKVSSLSLDQRADENGRLSYQSLYLKNVTSLAKVDPTTGEPLFQTVAAKLKPGDRLEPLLRAHGMKPDQAEAVRLLLYPGYSGFEDWLGSREATLLLGPGASPSDGRQIVRVIVRQGGSEAVVAANDRGEFVRIQER
jgi:hypothetical protein